LSKRFFTLIPEIPLWEGNKEIGLLMAVGGTNSNREPQIIHSKSNSAFKRRNEDSGLDRGTFIKDAKDLMALPVQAPVVGT